MVFRKKENGGELELGSPDLHDITDLNWIIFYTKMQEDSPGEQDKRIRNQRYNTPTKPKKLSVSTAKNKAKEFAAKDDKSTRVLAKQAILKELNTQLFVKAQGIAPQSRRKGDKTGGDTGMVQKFQGNICRMSDLCYGGKFKSRG